MFNCTIVRQNVMHLRETQKIADDLGIEITYTVPQVTDTYMANDATTDQFSLSESERVEACTFLKELIDRTQGSASLSRRYCNMLIELLETGKRNIGCPLAEGGLFLEPDGNGLPCWRSSSLLLGNALEDGIPALLEARDKPEYLEKLKNLCSDCPSNCYVDWTRRMFARRNAQSDRVSYN
jgi:MoaA/NifB/PqqE/SkfB family radical SAM enzyme